jgi:hypothetical protein
MKIVWELTARSFFDQLSPRDKATIQRQLTELGRLPVESTGPMTLLKGVYDQQRRQLYSLRAGADLRLLLYRTHDGVVVADIVRRSQLQGLQAKAGL